MERKGVSFVGMKLLLGINETHCHLNEMCFCREISIFVIVKINIYSDNEMVGALISPLSHDHETVNLMIEYS